MKKNVLAILILVVILAYGCAQQYVEPGLIVDEEPNLEEPVAEEVAEGPAETQGEDAETNAEEPKTSTATEPIMVDIGISGFAFNPATIRIAKGTTVTWTQKDSTKHSATSDDGVFDSPLLSKGETYSRTFNEAGTFEYHCTPHSSMKGKVIVE